MIRKIIWTGIILSCAILIRIGPSKSAFSDGKIIGLTISSHCYREHDQRNKERCYETGKDRELCDKEEKDRVEKEMEKCEKELKEGKIHKDDGAATESATLVP